MDELRTKLEQLCKEHKTSIDGINLLINYYVSSLHWSEPKAIEYCITLFDNGTIDEIKVIGGKTNGKDSNKG